MYMYIYKYKHIPTKIIRKKKKNFNNKHCYFHNQKFLLHSEYKFSEFNNSFLKKLFYFL